MSTTGMAVWRVAILAGAPIVMLAGFLYHPHIGNPFDPEFLRRLAQAVAADPTRWAAAHLLVAVGSGLIALAFVAARETLREAGETRWSAIGLPFVILGSTLYALLPAMEFAPLAAALTGGDIAAAQGAIYRWFVPNLFASGVIFAVGAFAFAIAVLRSGLLGRRWAAIVAAALAIMALARLTPLSVVQFEVQGLAGLAALWPLALAAWRRRHVAQRIRPAPPTTAAA